MLRTENTAIIADMEFGQGQFAKWLIAAGLIIAFIGVFMLLLGRMGLFKLPGDLQFGARNWRVFLPITTCILISIALTLLLWLIRYFRR